MKILRHIWARIVVIMTAPVTLELFRFWRRERAGRPVAPCEPEPEIAPARLMDVTLVRDIHKAARRRALFIVERRRRAMRAGKVPGVTV